MNEQPEHANERVGVIAWIVRHPKLSLAACVVLLLIGFTLLFHRAAENRLQRRIDAIRAKGEPATLDDLIARLPKAPNDENAAAIVLAQAEPLHLLKYPTDNDKELSYWDTVVQPPPGRRMSSEAIDALQELLLLYGPHLEEARAAVRSMSGYVAYEMKSPIIKLPKPWLSELRSITIVMRDDASLAANKGHVEEAVEKLFDVCKVGDFLAKQPFLTATSTQIAHYGLFQNGVEYLVNLEVLDEPLLARLQLEAQRQERAVDFKEAMLGDRVLYLDYLQWTLANKSTITEAGGPIGFERMTGGVNVWAYLPILPIHEIIVGLDALTAAIDAIEEADCDTLDRVEAVVRSTDNLPNYHSSITILVAGYHRASNYWVRHVARSRALQAALACERFRLAEGRWPESLDELAPKYLDAVPTDPFDKQPLRYAIVPEGIKVWSIDGNRQDDGGDIMRLERQTGHKSATDSGWLILNPEMRNRPSEEKDMEE